MSSSIAVFQRPPPRAAARQRTDPLLRAGLARARVAQSAPEDDGGRDDRHAAHHRRQGNPHRQHGQVRDAARSPARARRRITRRPSSTSCRRSRRRAAARDRVGELVVRRSRRRPPEGRRAADDHRGATRSTRRRCSASRRRCSRPRSTPPASSIDFWRFNAHYGQELLDEQPISDHTMWNQLEYRGLEGFVYAVTPFNFTVDRRQPADRAGADGQHGRLEAGVERDVLAPTT